MKVFAIADLHLSFAQHKPMSIFGEAWADHEQRLRHGWETAVDSGDLVLLPGDLSWAMRAEEAAPDLAWIDSLPGRKIFISGNHDYWCGKTSKIKGELPPSIAYLRNEAYVCDGVGICGTRGWMRPDDEGFVVEKDEKIWRRELNRMRLSAEQLNQLDWEIAVAMVHFPPRGQEGPSEMSELIESLGVAWCVYGHLHGEWLSTAFEGTSGGVEYRCVSADKVDFRPLLLFER